MVSAIVGVSLGDVAALDASARRTCHQPGKLMATSDDTKRQATLPFYIAQEDSKSADGDGPLR